jgi:RNA polymerase sigma-70 factor (ECF subfamily)
VLLKNDFISLYDEAFDDVYRYIYFKTGNKWDTDDLVSEIFRKAYEKYNISVKNKRAWLFIIAKNTLTDYYRRKRDIISDEIIEKIAYHYNCDNLIIKSEELGCLKNSLQELDEEEIEIIFLRYFSDMKFKEIGILLGKSESAVKMKASRIINKLRELFNICMEG